VYDVFKVDKEILIETLRDLKENRRLSSESEAIMKPLVGGKYLFPFSFVEASSTFSSRLDDSYSKGKTVVANFWDCDLECSILFPPSENEWVDGLKKGDEFESEVKVLALDNLYQRVIFGQDFQANDEVTEGTEEENEKLRSIGAVDRERGEKSETGDNEEKEIVSDLGNDEKTKAIQEEITSVAVPENLSEVGSEQSQVVKEKSLDAEEEKVLEPRTIVKDKRENPKLSDLKVTRKKTNRNISNKSKKEKFKTEENPPPIPSLKVQKKAREIDFRELERIRDKRYEDGAASLTDEENELLSLAKARSKLLSIQAANSSNSERTSRKRNPQSIKKADENMVTMGCRGIFGVIFGLFGLQAFFRGSGIVAIITIAIAWYLLNPIIKKFKEN
tara:strand:- start:586 stop:1755 length:1170 start_codon:yes stop_codon:yes gene_type:complete